MSLQIFQLLQIPLGFGAMANFCNTLPDFSASSRVSRMVQFKCFSRSKLLWNAVTDFASSAPASRSAARTGEIAHMQSTSRTIAFIAAFRLPRSTRGVQAVQLRACRGTLFRGELQMPERL